MTSAAVLEIARGRAAAKARPSRVYLVKDVANDVNGTAPAKEVLVRAKTKAGAVALVASALFKAELCSQDDLIRLMHAGETVMDAIESDD